MKYIVTPFFPVNTNNIQAIKKKFDLKLITKSKYTISKLLGNFKDKILAIHKAGVYAEFC